MGDKKRLASWGTRLAINFFTLILAILFFWFLGFIIKDLRTLPGPDYQTVTEEFFDPKLRNESDVFTRQLADLHQTITKKEQQQKLLRSGANDLEKTLDRLKQSSVDNDEKAEELARTAWQQLLERQQQIMTLGEEIIEANTEVEKLLAKKATIDEQLSIQEQSAHGHYSKLFSRHRLFVGFYQIGILSPFFLASIYFLLRCRKSPYFPIYIALGLATFSQIGFLMFDYFPREYFKYILIGFLILAILWLLIYSIRSVAKPTFQRLLKQNRESYERFLCTVCEYPIRTGPRTFLFWTRRTVHKTVQKTDHTEEEIYCCPYCGTSLYETCPACEKVRHAQLEFCRHCGDKKNLEPVHESESHKR